MQSQRRYAAKLALLAVALAGCIATAAAAREAECPVPAVMGVDQSPSNPDEYGKCTSALDKNLGDSNWCRFNTLGYCELGAG